METPPNEDRDGRDDREGQGDRAVWIKSMALYSAVLADLLGFTGAGVGLGYVSWKWLGCPWWCLLLLSVAGFSLAMYRLYTQFVAMK